MSESWWPAAPPRSASRESLLPQARRERIKVLHVITRFMDGSGGNTLLSAIGTAPGSYEMWVASSPGGPLWDRALNNGIRVVRLRRLREVVAPLDDAVVLWQLIRLMRRERFTIVHTHSSKAGLLGRLAAWLCRTPVIVHTIHGFSWHDFMSRGRRRFYIALERLIGRATDAFFAVSPQVAREAVEVRMALPATVFVVPSAVELDDIPWAVEPALRRELGVPADVALIGTLGRVEFQKAPFDFVRMAALVAATHPRCRFVWLGEGALLDQAQDSARRLGVDVMFPGFRPDAARIAASFDLYVVSSLYEGLGRGLCEAMASGRPVAATAVNGVLDVVEPGATGLLSPPADPEALARNVRWLLDHPDAARAMGEAGRARVRPLFDPEVMCRLLEQHYQRLLGFPETGAAEAGNRCHAASRPSPVASMENRCHVRR
jgi:glycosyltransferase involved in cell wall biosynthesis